MASTGLSSSAPSEGAAVSDADVVVGIACYDNAAMIGALVRSVSEGLRPCGRPSCIVVADGGSTDRTVELAREAVAGTTSVVSATYARPVVDPLAMPYHGLPGRPDAIRVVLQAAVERHATACVFLDASLTSLTPQWMPRLLEPVLAEQYDYVSPYYVRHPYEGALTKSIVYPMFRALYGVRLRQPAAGEFACSMQAAEYLLDQEFWDGEGAQTGIDLWVASALVTGRYRVCEAALGARTHVSRAETPDTSTTLAQVIGPLFSDLEARVDTWQRIRSSAPVPSFGDPIAAEPTSPEIHVEQMVEAFRLGYKALGDLWAWIMQPRIILQLKKLAEMPIERFRVSDELWAQIVYDFALAHRLHSMPRDHLLGALTPLYLGWLAAFILDLGASGLAEADRRVDRLCVMFETKKPHLIAGWRWPERFRA